MEKISCFIARPVLVLLFLVFSQWGLGSPGRVVLPSGVVIGDGCFTYQANTFPLDGRHYLVDASFCSQVQNDYIFGSFQEACKHISDGTPSGPMVLYIAPSVYWIDDPDDPTVAVGENGHVPFGMTVRCQNLHLIGLCDDPSHVVLASQRGQTQGADGNFTMFDFWGDGLEVSNLTMGNFCNVDLDYPPNPALGRKKRSEAITQAHVAYCHGDRVVARNVRFISRLNMNPLNGARRILFERCHMECTDDALTGNGVYLHCDFDFYGQKPFYTTHPAGAVFIDCDFNLKSDNADMFFCKSDGPLTLIDCRIYSSAKTQLSWTPYPRRSTRCYQSGVTMNGVPYIVGGSGENTVQIDNKQVLSLYKNDAGYRTGPLLAGDDGWNPLQEKVTDISLCANSLHLTPKKGDLTTGDSALILKANFLRHGGFSVLPLDSSLEWQVEEKYRSVVHLEPSLNGECRVYSSYDGNEPASCCVTATHASGLVGAAELILKGKQLPAPVLVSKPKIYIGEGIARLDYKADMGGKKDVSRIDWFRCRSKKGDGAILVSDGRQAPNNKYLLSAADSGWYLMAVLTLQSVRSGPALSDTIISRKALTIKDTGSDEILSTVFSDFPCNWQPAVLPGFWTVDGYKPQDTAQYDWSFDNSIPMWRYGPGINGALGEGLVQAQRGARLRYTPVQEHKGDMSLFLYVDPAKTAGQGFGSATGQYMDVCLKFDTGTLTGYGLRIIRTVKYANAVDFYLVRYDHGKVTPLTEPVSSVCYRTGCIIDLNFVGNILSADVSTQTPLDIPSDLNLSTSVHLSAKVTGNPFGGIHIQHTGSCGESVTMLHQLGADWE